MIFADILSIWILQHVNKHSVITSTMAGVNSKMDHELIKDEDILLVEAYASCRGVILYNVVIYGATVNCAVHVPASSVASIAIDIWGYICTW